MALDSGRDILLSAVAGGELTLPATEAGNVNIKRVV